MSWLIRTHLWIVVGIFALTGGEVAAQPRRPPPLPLDGPASSLSSVRLVENAQFRQVLNVARDCIHDKDWQDAIKTLQLLLNEKNDSFVKISERDPADPKKEITRWASAKSEANRLLGSMPAKGLEEYEKAVGAEARKLLDEAVKNDDRAKIADVAHRFRHTRAGAEANKLLPQRPLIEVGKQRGWPSWRGNVANDAQAAGDPPLLTERLWTHSAFPEK